MDDFTLDVRWQALGEEREEGDKKFLYFMDLLGSNLPGIIGGCKGKIGCNFLSSQPIISCFLLDIFIC